MLDFNILFDGCICWECTEWIDDTGTGARFCSDECKEKSTDPLGKDLPVIPKEKLYG